MQSNNDGGPAFPTKIKVEGLTGYYDSHVSGMTLRDYFAGQALVGGLVGFPHSSVESSAESAYQIADAMLRAREAR